MSSQVLEACHFHKSDKRSGRQMLRRIKEMVKNYCLRGLDIEISAWTRGMWHWRGQKCDPA
jgi:hypothetical protein